MGSAVMKGIAGPGAIGAGVIATVNSPINLLFIFSPIYIFVSYKVFNFFCFCSDGRKFMSTFPFKFTHVIADSE